MGKRKTEVKDKKIRLFEATTRVVWGFERVYKKYIHYVAGLIGHAQGEITGCYNAVSEVKAHDALDNAHSYAGGITAFAEKAIYNSHNGGNVQGGTVIGVGTIGANSTGGHHGGIGGSGGSSFAGGIVGWRRGWR